MRPLTSAFLLSALLLAPLASLAAADARDDTGTTAPPAATTCLVCGRTLNDDTAKTVTIDGRQMRCCSDACAAEVRQRPEYYKGMLDGADRERNGIVGPKGGVINRGPVPDK